jgi:hypothetical protein
LEMVKTLTLILRDLRWSLFLVSLEVNKPEVIKELILLVLQFCLEYERGKCRSKKSLKVFQKILKLNLTSC